MPATPDLNTLLLQRRLAAMGKPMPANPMILGGNHARIGAAPPPSISAGPVMSQGDIPVQIDQTPQAPAPPRMGNPFLHLPTMRMGSNINLPSHASMPSHGLNPQIGGTHTMNAPDMMGTSLTMSDEGPGLPTTGWRDGNVDLPSAPVEAPAMAEGSSEQIPAPKVVTHVQSAKELPYQTYERLTGNHWTGGASDSVKDLMAQLGIGGHAGSAEANLMLQKALLARNTANVSQLNKPEGIPSMPWTLGEGS